MSRGARIALKIAASLAILLVILAVTAVLVLQSDWLHEKIRQAIVAELERATGGTVTLGNFAVDWKTLRVRFQDLTLRGKEPANVPPLLQAKSVQVGLKIVSFWKKDVDLQSIEVDEPRVNLIVAADGSTNIPEPKVKGKSAKTGLEPILDWKVAKFSLQNGTMLFGETKSGLNARGENLRAQFSYDFTGPRYKGQLSIEPLEINARKMAPVNMNVYLVLGLEKNRIEVSSAKFDIQRSFVEASGSIVDLASPKGKFRFSAHVAVDQAAKFLKIGAARQGAMDLAGSATYNNTADYTVLASVIARGLEVRQDSVHVSGVRMTSLARLNPRGLQLDGMAVDILGGRFTGRADLPKLERVLVNGAVQGIPIQRALEMLAPQLPVAQRSSWSGLASGPIQVEARLAGGPVVASGNFAIVPAPGGIPVEGSLDARYDGKSETLSLGRSHLVTPGASLDVSGALGSQLDVRLESTNLEDMLPAINAVSTEPVQSLPVQLKNGKATFEGTVTGKLNSPQIAGSLALSDFVYAGIEFDRFNGQVTVDQSSAHVQNAALARGAARAQVSATVALTDWKATPQNAIAGTVALQGAEVSEILKLAGQKQVLVSGALTASARVSGTIESPRAGADITVTKGFAYDEPFDRLQATVDYSPQAINVSKATVTAGPAQVTATASFEPTRPFDGAPELRDGRVKFQIASNDMAIQRFQTMQRLRPDVSGLARVSFVGAAAIHRNAAGSPEALLTSLNGDVTASGLRLESRDIGNFKAAVDTQASVLHVKLDSNFLNSNLQAAGQWRLEPGYPGEITARFSQISLSTVRNWLTKPSERSGLSLDGSTEGTISITGPALDPDVWKASATLSKLELYPAESKDQRAGNERFTLRNQGPIRVTLEKSTLSVSAAQFSGPSSNFTVAGTVLLRPKATLDLRVNGAVNLAIAKTFVPDIESAGAVTVNASIRGAPDQPLVNGQLDVKGGSVHLLDITTGLSGANGTIVFSGNQATIQKLTGQVGGGSITLGGVVGYAAGEISYRVDANAKNVRVRYPEGVSTSFNADLSLRGTSQRSTLSGLVTVLRTGFTPRTDFSSVLGSASQPVRTPSARAGPLGGMQFDVRIETAPDISFESSLAQDLQVEGSLRLQGTPYNPVLLGRLNISQGEISFFGTTYTVNQGSITFANPVKLEPVLNIDLDTKVQGIAVTLTIAGPINKLTITPRSDPPMQYSDVLALLATGSTPSTDPTMAARQNAPQTFTQLGASTLIGQVVANPVSSRLQRFFGVSKLKIDPQFTGVENNPQARLTVEQQVNKDVTFTYITNVASANQLIVRIEWSVNRNWSAIAVRDENGLFGLDFLYKKRFK